MIRGPLGFSAFHGFHGFMILCKAVLVKMIEAVVLDFLNSWQFNAVNYSIHMGLFFGGLVAVQVFIESVRVGTAKPKDLEARKLLSFAAPGNLQEWTHIPRPSCDF